MNEKLTELTDRECGWCGGPFVPSRSDQVYCTDSHRVMAHRRRKKAAEARDRLVTIGGQEFTRDGREDEAESLVKMAERTTKYTTHGYGPPEGVRVGSRRMEEYGYSEYPDDVEDEDVEDDEDDASPGDQAWSDEYVLQQKLDDLWEDFVARAKPYDELIRRNPGVYPAEPARMYDEYVAATKRLKHERENAKGKARADRERLQRIAQAEQERRGRAAAAAFANDMGRSRRGDYAPSGFQGRAVHEVFRW
jgi:hypothetical protein